MFFLTGWLLNVFQLCMQFCFILIFQLLIFIIWVKKRPGWKYLWWLLHDMDICQQISSFLQPFLTYVRSISRLSSNNLASIIDIVYRPMLLCAMKGIRTGWGKKYSPKEKVFWKCINKETTYDLQSKHMMYWSKNIKWEKKFMMDRLISKHKSNQGFLMNGLNM